ncbi:MAG TPA: DUF748 domain-containing protein [Pseudomonadales bacterium]
MKIERKWWYVAIGIAAYALAGFVLAPWLAKRTLVDILDQRLHLNVQVEDVSINPFTLAVAADGFAAAERDGSPVFAFERLFVNFEFVSLFRWAFTFDELHLIRPSVNFERLSKAETNFSRLGQTWTQTTEGSAPEASDNDLPRLIVADLQIVEGRLRVADHTRREPFATELAPINLAVADLSTLPEHSGTQQVTIRTESGAEVAWTGSLSVNPLSITGNVRLQGAHTPLLFRYFRDELRLPIGIEGGVIEARLDYRVALSNTGVWSARVDNLDGTVSAVTVTQPDHPPLLTLGEFTVRGGRFAWPEQTVHVDEVQIDEVRIDAYRDPDGIYLPIATLEERVAAAEQVVADANDTLGPEGQGWSVTADQLRLTRWALDHTDTGLENGSVTISGMDLTLSDLSNAPGHEMGLALEFSPALGGRVSLNGAFTVLPEPTLRANLAADAVPLAIAQPYLDTLVNVGIADGHLGLAGIIESRPDEPLLYQGDFRIAALELTDRLQDERLLAWQVLAVDRVRARPTGLELSSLQLDAPYARVEIHSGGASNLNELLVTRDETPAEEAEQPETASAPEAPPAGAAAEPFLLVIDETRIKGGSAYFEDRNLPLPFEAKISGLNGTLSTLASDSNAASRVAIEGQVNEYGRVKIGGRLQPFSPLRGTDVEVAFENVELPRMSPYTIKFAGRRIAAGRTDLTLSYKMTDGQLAGDNRLVVRDLRLGEKVPHPNAMNLPLDLAVALLKDPSGVIDFRFPVSGSLEDPHFSYGDAIMKAFSNVIVGLAAAPFKLLGALVGVEPDEFEDVSFEAGRADLTPPQREVLAKLADALNQRPQLSLALTPVSDPAADRRALQAAQIEAALEARMTEDGPTDNMISERRRKHLEALYDEAGLTPDRTVRQAQASPPDAEGNPVFDELLYTEGLRRALIEAAEIPDEALATLAAERVGAVRGALAATADLAPERLTTRPGQEKQANKRGLVKMPLEVSARRPAGSQ